MLILIAKKEIRKRKGKKRKPAFYYTFHSMMSGLLLKFWLLKCAFRRLNSSIRGNNSVGSTAVGTFRREQANHVRTAKINRPIYSDFDYYTFGFFFSFFLYSSGEKKSISDELEFGSRDAKPSLEKIEGGGEFANKMFFYPIRHFLLSKLLMCAVQIDCGRTLISTHRKFGELFREKSRRYEKRRLMRY